METQKTQQNASAKPSESKAPQSKVESLLEQLIAKESKPAPTVAVDTSEFCNYLDTAKFNQMWRVASLFAKTMLIPTQYRGKPDDCFVVVQMAARLGVDPLMFMQNTYMVHGKPGMEAKLVIALINNKGPFEGPIQWEFTGEGNTRECTAVGELSDGTKCKASVSMKMVIAEGWIKNDKWKNMPDLMFRYRSAAFLGRLYCPEVLMGMQTVDEIYDVGEQADTYEDTAKGTQAEIETKAGSEVTEVNFEQEAPPEEEAELKVSEDGVDESFLDIE